jgi:hypothetical protein
LLNQKHLLLLLGLTAASMAMEKFSGDKQNSLYGLPVEEVRQKPPGNIHINQEQGGRKQNGGPFRPPPSAEAVREKPNSPFKPATTEAGSDGSSGSLERDVQLDSLERFPLPAPKNFG